MPRSIRPLTLVLAPVLALVICLSLSSCAGGFDRSAGRAASNASDALGILWGKGGKKKSARSAPRSRSSNGSSRSKRVTGKKVTDKKVTGSGAVTPKDDEGDDEESSTLGGMERPGAR